MNNIHQIKQIIPLVRKMFVDMGIKKSQIEITPLQGGNNRVYKVITDNKNYVLKKYFKSDRDKRDRLHAEYLFFNYAQNCKTALIPDLLSCDMENSMALHEYVEGRKLKKGEIEKEHVRQALGFVRAINQHKNRKSSMGASLSFASEGCFSIEEHIQLMDRRITALSGMEIKDDISKEAEQFILAALVPEWKSIRVSLNSYLEKKKKLERDEQIISPSDFGFHNAILKNDNQVYFIDFEYAGWDDPVKMICDFFCQPGIPVPFRYFEYFTGGINDIIKSSYNLEEKAKLLLPLHRIKWCCIILNDFLKFDAKRKQFASFNEDKRKEQLKKAMGYARQYHI